MKRPINGSTLKQVAYARRLFNADGQNKKDIARSVGYSPTTANNVASKIESTEGFQIAMFKIAQESNNLVLAALMEYKRRGLSAFTNKDLNGALNAISLAWDRIGKQRAEVKTKDEEQNQLRKIFMQKVDNQVINVQPYEKKKKDRNINIDVEKIIEIEQVEVDKNFKEPEEDLFKENRKKTKNPKIDLDF